MSTTEAQKLAEIVATHVEAGDVAEFRLSRERRTSWFLDAGLTILGACAVIAGLVPLVMQLADNGFGSAAAALALASMGVLGVAGLRLLDSSKRGVWSEPKVVVDIFKGQRPHFEGTKPTSQHRDFVSEDVGTFATAVSRVADRERPCSVG
ncbi:hypothetical protein [Mycobacteroides immunogenum]|uniref:hypothetical protein n=1 Tax=Mycobacteroides immunogenum TaxID=83262 RepID=UPI001041E007|nr:hypothetical protein [Mycobacteroides immunogenum]